MLQVKYLCPGFLFFFFGLTFSSPAEVNTNPYVKVQGRQLVVDFTGKGNYQPFTIRGVDYSPTPIGRYSSDWGYDVYYPDPNPPGQNNYNPNNLPSNMFADPAILNRDFSLLKRMNANTIRIWSGDDMTECDTVNPQEYSCGRLPNMITSATLTTAANYGLHVIAGFYVPPIGAIYSGDSTVAGLNAPFDPANPLMINDILRRFQIYIGSFKNRPEILFWVIGNENNLSLDPNSRPQVKAWYSLVNQMAGLAHQLEGANYHPVAIVNGDDGDNGPHQFMGDPYYGADDASLSNVDIWGINIYRGQSFGDFFVQYKSLSAKPLWISEYGIDAFQSCDTTRSGCDPNDPSGVEDQHDQALWDGSLWDEVAGNADIAIGASVMEYSDEWWKPNDWICSSLPYSNETPYPNDPAESNTYCHWNHMNFGFGPGSSWDNLSFNTPDHYSNEAWWGIMAISNTSPQKQADTLTPRQVYYTLQTKFLNAINNIPLASYLASPVVGTMLNSTSALFAWSQGRGVSRYELLVGSRPGSGDIYKYTGSKVAAVMVSRIPLRGKPVYVRLGSLIHGVWHFVNYTYKTIDNTITASAGGEGRIIPSGVVSVSYGKNQSFVIVPRRGYSISKVEVDDATVTPPPATYTFEEVTSPQTISVSFKRSPK